MARERRKTKLALQIDANWYWKLYWYYFKMGARKINGTERIGLNQLFGWQVYLALSYSPPLWPREREGERNIRFPLRELRSRHPQVSSHLIPTLLLSWPWSAARSWWLRSIQSFKINWLANERVAKSETWAANVLFVGHFLPLSLSITLEHFPCFAPISVRCFFDYSPACC